MYREYCASEKEREMEKKQNQKSIIDSVAAVGLATVGITGVGLAGLGLSVVKSLKMRK